jgi:serine/threonine protein kinase/dienelactone hydrolase
MIGKMISHYKILEKLGEGGMGIIYKARDTKLNRIVALKFLPPYLSQAGEEKKRFIREAQAASALDHPNICTIYEINETDDGQLFIAMASYEGETLKEKMVAAQHAAPVPEGSPIPLDQAISITIQIAEGLAKAHEKGIIHRDIKPANILITEEGQVKIIDFGLAKLAGRTALTKEGTTLGTVAYMSPEQTQGTNVDHRADIWALGVILYEMLTGERPFKGDYEQAIIFSIMNEDPVPVKKVNPSVPLELEKIVNNALIKDPGLRTSSATKILKDLKAYQDSLWAEELGALNLRKLLRSIRKPRFAVPAIGLILLITIAVVWFFNRQTKIRWAKENILPEVERLVEESWRDFTEPYKLAVKAEKIIPKDPKLAELLSKCSLKINVDSEPLGANIYVKLYNKPENEWEYLGISPLENVRLPIGIFRWKIEKEGYEAVLAASSSWNDSLGQLIPNRIFRILDKKGTIPNGMVRVPGAKTTHGELNAFFIDKFEVTNRQYKAFIDAGGYKKKEFWKHPFIKGGRVLTWEEAMKEFVDLSDQPGPSTWLGGDYLQEQDEYPVSGISWYEATAYAEFAGKSLPTGTHWGIARGENTPMISAYQFGGNAIIVPFSNFGFKGPVQTGSLRGITAYGVYDMAGNVREWCWNETQQGRLIRGGAWNDNPYMFGNLSQAPAFNRSSKNGFRCALYPNPDKVLKSTFGVVELGETKNFYQEKPVSDTIFQVYREQFAYDKINLNVRLESRDESNNDWIQERITFDAAYGNERIVAVLFLPRNTEPPYQTVIYFPGAQALWRKSIKDLENDGEFRIFLSFIVKNGRAVLYPVYKGTMERDFVWPTNWDNTHRQTEYRIQVVKDFRRCIDYLETRSDIDTDKLAYYGMSWGGNWPGTLISAVEERHKTCIFLAGGFKNTGRPEVHMINYVPRVKMPTLMLNGRYDSSNGFDTSIKPMFDLLGTPDERKILKVYDTDHIPPRNEFIKEILAWLECYLGPVE